MGRFFFPSFIRQKTLPRNNNDKGKDEQTSLTYGVSLTHLASLPIPHTANFTAVTEYVKKQTKGLKGYKSYAEFLKKDPKTKHLVRSRATVFVSYASSGSFGKTIDALKEHFKDKLDQTFVWMDFAVVDQHKPLTSKIDFGACEKTFRESLSKIGQAILVLTPGEKPIAFSRLWYYFDLVNIIQSNIPFSYVIPSQDEPKLIESFQNGADANEFFAGINVDKAHAFKKSDQQGITARLREIGISKVHDLVKQSLKTWLLQVTIKAEENAAETTIKVGKVLNARASLHHALGELEEALPLYEQALVIVKCISNYNLDTASQLQNLGALLHAKDDDTNAEPLIREALALRKTALGEDHPDVAKSAALLSELKAKTVKKA